MNDQSFLQQFEACTLPKEYFTHRGHLRLAYLYLSQHTQDEAITKIIQGIKRYAASLGAAQKYHETMTIAWIKLTANAMRQHQADNFDAFLAMHTALQNSRLLFDYYSSEVLNSDQAKQAWVQPDLKPLD